MGRTRGSWRSCAGTSPPRSRTPSDDDDDETADGIEIAKEEESDEEVTRLARPVNEEVTRPSITDEDEEETKVEATDPLIKVDNGGDDVTTALAEQASVEREKALRRSSPSLPASAMPPGETSDVEFADPDDGDDDGHDSPTASYSDAAPETSPLAAAITRRPPPGAPSDGCPARRPALGSRYRRRRSARCRLRRARPSPVGFPHPRRAHDDGVGPRGADPSAFRRRARRAADVGAAEAGVHEVLHPGRRVGDHDADDVDHRADDRRRAVQSWGAAARSWSPPRRPRP